MLFFHLFYNREIFVKPLSKTVKRECKEGAVQNLNSDRMWVVTDCLATWCWLIQPLRSWAGLYMLPYRGLLKGPLGCPVLAHGPGPKTFMHFLYNV